MAKEQETIADIIAWLRKPREGENAYLTLWRDEIADRLKAAHKRESDEMKKQTGNAAKLRDACAEAAESAAEIMERVRHKDRLAFNIANYIEGVARTALAAPARNCDKYANHNDAMKAFEAFVREQGKLGFINPYTEAFKWLFAPATEKEGGAK
jgi:hypothetical protein